jgi:hypothetical protein
MSATRAMERRKQSASQARRRLAQKQVSPAYRPPRGNQELDRSLTDHSVDRLESIVR